MTTETDISKTTEINMIAEEIEDLEHNIKRNYANIDHARVSTFRYFWPFLVASLIEGLGGYVFSGIDAFLRASRHEEYHAVQNTQLIVIFLIFLALHIFGGMFARYKAKKKNNYLEQQENNRIADIRKCEKKIIELKVQEKELLDKTPEDNSVVETSVSDSDSYIAKVAELNRIGKKIEQNNNELCKIRIETSVPKKESMCYFWPFLLVSMVLVIPLVLRLMIVFYDYPGFLPILISLHVFVLIHVFGGAFARKMTARYNKRTEEKNASLLVRLGRIQDELAGLEIEKQKLLEQLKDFDGIVPEI